MLIKPTNPRNFPLLNGVRNYLCVCCQKDKQQPAVAIIINKLGDWNSNKKIQLAGTYKFIELFYGFYHAVYQKIEYRDLSQKFIMISVVKKQRTENFTYTISKNPNKDQGGDFILEGKVCQQKILAFKGVDLEEI